MSYTIELKYHDSAKTIDTVHYERIPVAGDFLYFYKDGERKLTRVQEVVLHPKVSGLEAIDATVFIGGLLG